MDGDSGIEDIETLESPCYDMDSSKQPKEEDINHKLQKENGTGAGDVIDVVSVSHSVLKSSKSSTQKKCASKSQNDDGNSLSEEDVDLISSYEMETNGEQSSVSHKRQRKAKRKCTEGVMEIEIKQITNADVDVEDPSKSKKAKSDESDDISKQVIFTKIIEKNSKIVMNGLSSDESVAENENLSANKIHNNIKDNQKDVSNGKLKRDPKDQFCSMCEGINGDLITCSGPCLNQFHPNCLGLNNIPSNDFTCDPCTTGLHECFVCKKNTGEIRKCSQNTCGKFYHIQCLDNNNCTSSENKIKNKFTCPLHHCNHCNQNKSLQITNGKRVVKCVKCPIAYHRGSCMPAGCFVLTASHMICDEHYSPKKTRNVLVINTLWCISCSFGGSLVCCDTCPASFHVECTDDLNVIPEGAWQCSNCRNGNKLRYGDIVWVKFSIYRWWPGKICLPEDVPFRVQSLPHSVGEFPVLFFGSRDYAWLNPCRVFKYAKGDQGGSTKKNYLEKYFQKALEEARDAFLEMEKKREEHIQAYDKKQSNKPPTYRHIKVNKPVSCVRTLLDRSEWPICQCKEGDPCRSECLNKMLYYECSPSQCPNREHCRNQRIQKFEYAKTKMFKCEEKGWGLKADQVIKAGDFVIEYVGELIDEATCHKRIQQYHERDIYDYYFLTIDKDNIIDAYPRGNLSRFMNHSCDPNCETLKWTVNGEVRVGLFATRDIPIDEELCFNYNLDSLGNEKKKCKCGSANCSGYLGVQPKTQHSISVAEKSKKLKEKVTSKRKLKRKKVAKIVHEDECFSCGDGGELLCCDRKQCTKAYHQDCLIMEKAPTGKWQCPWHFCDECGKLARSMCSLCPNSFCESHFDGQMIELKDDVLVCPAHDEEEMEKLKDRESGKSSPSKHAVNTTSPKSKKVSKSQKKSQQSIIKAERVENTPTTDVDDVSLPKLKKSLKLQNKKNPVGKKLSQKLDEVLKMDNHSKEKNLVSAPKKVKGNPKPVNSKLKKDISAGKKSSQKSGKKEELANPNNTRNVNHFATQKVKTTGQKSSGELSEEDDLDNSRIKNVKHVPALKAKTASNLRKKKGKDDIAGTISSEKKDKEEEKDKPSNVKHIKNASTSKLKNVSKLQNKKLNKGASAGKINTTKSGRKGKMKTNKK